MKPERILAYIDLLIGLIDKDTDEFAMSIVAKTKAEKRLHRIRSNYAHTILIDSAKKAVNET